MSEIIEIKPHYNRKVQLERFEPIQQGAEVVVSVEEGEDPDEVYDKWALWLEDAVERNLARRVAEAKMQEEDDEGDG